ncbi:MAG TPA: hypothetical protein VGM36_08140 [Rhizomicrobium sp.]
MRIDASTLLLAAQASAMRPASAKAPTLSNVSETPDVTKSSGAVDRKQTPLAGAISRPGAQLDIKV